MSGTIAQLIAALRRVLTAIESAETEIRRADDLLDEVKMLVREPLEGADVQREVFDFLDQAQAGLRASLPLCSRADEAVDHVLTTITPALPETPATTSPRPEPSSLSVPHPSTLPRHLMAASLDPAWAQTQQAKLADREGGTGATTGLLTVAGMEDLYLVSGRPQLYQGQPRDAIDRAELERIQRTELTLRTNGFADGLPDLGRVDVAAHAETKAAALMAELGLTWGAMAINNTAICRGRYGCRVAVPMLLPRGSTLVVWERVAAKPKILEGRAP